MPYLGLIMLAVMVITIIDIASADEHQIRGLPRLLWLLLAIVVPLAGAIAWFVAGRPATTASSASRSQSAFPEYEKPGRFAAQEPADDEAFLRQCRERAEQQRRAAKQQQREADGEADTGS